MIRHFEGYNSEKHWHLAHVLARDTLDYSNCARKSQS